MDLSEELHYQKLQFRFGAVFGGALVGAAFYTASALSQGNDNSADSICRAENSAELSLPPETAEEPSNDGLAFTR